MVMQAIEKILDKMSNSNVLGIFVRVRIQISNSVAVDFTDTLSHPPNFFWIGLNGMRKRKMKICL